mmetsp:Transcript_130266/g.376857  ORF Transcript_130266/g.376857 Transcript_130266/m.376857 type:complete len:244 (+) Transcript_130266:758-1489(+)
MECVGPDARRPGRARPDFHLGAVRRRRLHGQLVLLALSADTAAQPGGAHFPRVPGFAGVAEYIVLDFWCPRLSLLVPRDACLHHHDRGARVRHLGGRALASHARGEFWRGRGGFVGVFRLRRLVDDVVVHGDYRWRRLDQILHAVGVRWLVQPLAVLGLHLVLQLRRVQCPHGYLRRQRHEGEQVGSRQAHHRAAAQGAPRRAVADEPLQDHGQRQLGLHHMGRVRAELEGRQGRGAFGCNGR